MLIRNIIKTTLVAGLGLSLIACGGGRKNATGYSNSGSNSSMRSMAVADSEKFYGETISQAEEKSLQNQKTLYFGFDQFNINERNKMILLSHAKKLLENPELKLRIEGHTDERGSREYNIALGERRAKSAARILAMKGISEDQFVVISYGKEKPASSGSDEHAWEMNRRNELEYENRG